MRDFVHNEPRFRLVVGAAVGQLQVMASSKVDEGLWESIVIVGFELGRI